MRILFTVFLLLVTSLCTGSSINTPPDIYFDREWILTENLPVGSIVTRLRVADADNDSVTIRIGDPSSRHFQRRADGASFFEVDADNRVKLTKSLQGMAGEFFLVGIIASDGNVPKRVDAKVTIKRSKEAIPSTNPPRLPTSFDIGRPPPLSEIHGHAFANQSVPPLLHLGPFKVWKVPSDAKVSTAVGTVEAEDLSNTYLRFFISPETLLRIDHQTGKVTVAKPLSDQIGDHKFEIKVADKFSSIAETVTLKVLPLAGDDPPAEGVAELPPQPPPPPTSRRPPSLETSTPKLTLPDEAAATPSSGDEEVLGWNVVVLVFALGVIPVLLLVFFVLYRWRRKKALRDSAKESEKRSSITPPDQGGHRDSIISGIFSMVGLHQRAEGNRYEDDVKAPKVPNREFGKSTKSFKSSNTNGDDSWEFPRHKLRVLGILGEGCFGQVWKCEATDLDEEGPTLVAVKTLKESAGAVEQKDLLQELQVLKNLGHHPNVVSLLGCCTEKEPIFVVLEYMIGGKLQDYLRSSRAEHPYGNLHGTSTSLTPKDLTIFALQVVKGMEFLSKHGIIHRDLAARNILVGENKICKVADFGFARNVANNHVYERKSDGRLPIRWMAPESLFDNIFTSKSDVWSFGILLWEIVTLGSTPYPGMSAADVMRKIKDGYRLEKPDHCRREIYNIMYYCWYSDQTQRPAFLELIQTLESLIMTEVEYIHLDNFPDHNYYNFSSILTSGELL